MRVVRLHGLADPRIDDYRTLSDAELLRGRGLFVAEGRLVVGRLLEDRHDIVSLLLNGASLTALEGTLAGCASEATVFVCDTADFASITGFHLHRGCLALVRRPPPRTPDDVADGGDRLLVLEGVTDADNVGSAFRNAAAFGATGVLLSPTCCDPLYRKAIRTSMGSALRVPFARLETWPADLEAVKARGFTLVALTPKASATDLASFAGHGLPRRVALLAGSEGPGLTAAAEAMADVAVRIPIREQVDSLNVATATGIALFYLNRVIP